MEADHRKRMLEAKLEQFRKRVEQFQSMAPDIPGEFGAHGGPQGSQPAKAVASSPKPATASPKPPVRPPQPPIPPQPSQRSVGNRRSPSQSGRHLGTIQAPASQATPPDDALCTPPVLGPTAPPPAQAAVVPDVTSHAPQHALITSPAQQGTSSCGSRSIDTRSSSSSASVHAHPGLHVLDTLFVHGSPDLKMLMQYDSARCWFSASGYMDGCARCTSGAGHVHSPTTLLADCLHSLITVAGTSSATDSTSTSAAACMTSLFSCLVSLCGIRTAAPALAEAASADSSAPPLVVGPVCAFDAVCTVCDPVRAASLHLMQLLVYACPTLLQSERRRQWSPSRARPAEPGTSHQTASPDASLPMFKGAVRMGAGITDTHPSQTVLSGAMQRLSLRVTSRLASTSALAAPTRASAHTSVNIVSVAVNGILQASTSLGTRGDPSVARTTLVSRMSTRCTSLLQLLQASIVLSGTSDCITPLIPLLSSRAVAVIIASCGFYLRDWLAAWSAAASDDMRTSLAATLPDVCMLAVAALQFLSEVVISVPPSRFESIASHITDALKWACGLLVDMPPLHSVSADLLLSPALQHFVQVHVEVNRLIGCIISCQERAGVTCILTLSTGAAVSLTQDATQEDDVTPATAAADDGTPAAPRAGCDCDAGALHTCGLKVTANAFSCPLPALIHACHLIARTASELLLAPHKLQDAGTLVLASMKRCVRSTLAVIATSCAALSALGTPSPRPLASPGLLGRACVQAALAGLLFRLSKAAVLAEWCADANSALYISHLERVLLDFAPDALALSKR